MGRGRRDPENCALTDVIDGWTVDAYEPDRRLRLRSDLKLPVRSTLRKIFQYRGDVIRLRFGVS